MPALYSLHEHRRRAWHNPDDGPCWRTYRVGKVASFLFPALLNLALIDLGLGRKSPCRRIPLENTPNEPITVSIQLYSWQRHIRSIRFLIPLVFLEDIVYYILGTYVSLPVVSSLYGYHLSDIPMSHLYHGIVFLSFRMYLYTKCTSRPAGTLGLLTLHLSTKILITYII